MNWYLSVFRKYAVFSGRARRREYWYFVLFNIIVGVVLVCVDVVMSSALFGSPMAFFTALYGLASFIPG